MKKSTKAALLSALVFPGVGHFYLKQRLPGAVIACLALFLLYWLFSNIMARAQGIAMAIQRGEVAPDVASIMELMASQPADAGAQMLNYAGTAIMVVWLVGIFDAYRRGRHSTN